MIAAENPVNFVNLGLELNCNQSAKKGLRTFAPNPFFINYLMRSHSGTSLAGILSKIINSHLYVTSKQFIIIKTFSHIIENGYLSWKYAGGLDSGTIPYPVNSEKFSSFQRTVIAKYPRQFSELEGILL